MERTGECPLYHFDIVLNKLTLMIMMKGKKQRGLRIVDHCFLILREKLGVFYPGSFTSAFVDVEKGVVALPTLGLGGRTLHVPTP